MPLRAPDPSAVVAAVAHPGTVGAAVPSRPRIALTDAQARLWDLEAGAPVRGMHGFAFAYDLRGVLDVGLLERAIDAVAARHATLRVRLVSEQGRAAFEEVAPAEQVRLERRAAATGDARRPGSPFESQIRAEAAHVIDPMAGPAWRCVLFHRSDDEHLLLLHFHHLIADRWSVAVFVSDLGKAYQAIDAGETALAPLPERRVVSMDPWLESPDGVAAVAHWRRVFAEPAEQLALPAARQSAAHTGYLGERYESDVDSAITSAVKTVAAAQATTPFAVVLAAFAATLHAHTGQEDLLLCTPMTGRHRAGTRGVIGYLNNIVPLRLALGGDPAFSALVAHASSSVRSAYEHQDLPFQLIAALPEAAGVRLSRCLFAFQNIPGLDLQLPGIASTHRDLPSGTANFDLSVFVEERDGGLHVMLDYKTALFDRAAVVTLTERFLDTLRSVTERPDGALSTLPRFHSTDAAPAHEPALTGPTLAAANELEQRMIDLWRELFGRSAKVRIGASSDFFALGGDSMQAARLIARIRRDFGQELPLATLFEAPTPRQLVRRMTDPEWKAPWLALVPVRTTGTRPPLFCIAGGGGNVINYRLLADSLHEDQPVYCLQAKGLKSTEMALDSVEEMAEHYLAAVRHIRPRGPYLLAGHSLGAAVAYEMAQQLSAVGEEVPLLALLDHPGPNIRSTRADWLRYHLINLSMLGARDGAEYVSRSVKWRLQSLRAKRWARQKSAGATVADAKNVPLPPRSSVSPMVTILERSLEALRNYKVRPYSGRVTLFRAERGSPRILADQYGGWGAVALGGVDVREVPGTHQSMLTEPHVRGLGGAISSYLDAVAERAPVERQA